MKTTILTIIGVIGSFIASAFGGWSKGLTALIIFMSIDYITGLIVAGVFKNSPKTQTGGLESRAGWKGLCRKGVTLLIVLAACWVDIVTGSQFVKNATIIGFSANEFISIIENAGLMGVPIPEPVIKAIDVLQSRAGELSNAVSKKK